MHLDARGSTVAQVAVGGEVAVDSAGNIAVASVVSGALNVASFTPALAARWQVSYPSARTKRRSAPAMTLPATS